MNEQQTDFYLPKNPTDAELREAAKNLLASPVWHKIVSEKSIGEVIKFLRDNGFVIDESIDEKMKIQAAH